MRETDPGPFCTLDIEASGFGRGSYPIEVGWVRADGRAACTLIRPLPEWTHWDPRAEQMHGISRATLERHGRDAARVAELMSLDLDGEVVYCDGWAHDYPWLALLFDAAGRMARFRLEPVTRIVAEPERRRLPDLQRQALTELGLTRHRASNDARALRQALDQLVRPRVPA